MQPKRFVGLDIHQRQVVIAAVAQPQKGLLSPQKITNQQFGSWANQNRNPSDQVAIEATTHSWTFHDQLAPLVKCILVANSFKLKLITASSCKTDQHAALVLAKRWAANLLPTGWVLPPPVRDLRHLTPQRGPLIQKRTAAKHRLQGIWHQRNLLSPTGNPCLSSQEAWWQNLALSPVEKLPIKHAWLTIHHGNELIQETEAARAQ